jgi:DNA-binding FadR family transcriptional regulator
MPGTVKMLDIPALHRYLWARSDRHNRIIVNQQILAEQLAVSHDCVSEALIKMTQEGLVAPAERLEFGVKRYTVIPPEEPVAKIDQRRIAVWG